MTARNYIAGDEVEATYGLTFLEGTIRELIIPGVRKEIYSHDWKDETGTDRDVSAVYFQSKTVSLPSLIQGSSAADLQTKLGNLITAIKGPGRFNLDAVLINRRFSMLYDSITDFQFANAAMSVATFTMNLIDDSPNTITPIP